MVSKNYIQNCIFIMSTAFSTGTIISSKDEIPLNTLQQYRTIKNVTLTECYLISWFLLFKCLCEQFFYAIYRAVVGIAWASGTLKGWELIRTISLCVNVLLK